MATSGRLLGEEVLWKSWERVPKYLEFDDFAWGCARVVESVSDWFSFIIVGPFCLSIFLMNGKAKPHM